MNHHNYWILTRWTTKKMFLAYLNHKECGIKQFWSHQQEFDMVILFIFQIEVCPELGKWHYTMRFWKQVEVMKSNFHCSGDCVMSLAEHNWTWPDGLLHGNFPWAPVFPFLVQKIRKYYIGGPRSVIKRFCYPGNLVVTSSWQIQHLAIHCPEIHLRFCIEDNITWT